MTDYTADAPPPLPLDALRDALGQADLKAALALVDAHDRAVRQALPADEIPLLDPRQVQAWQGLAERQQALADELAVLRDQVAEQLQQLQRHQRGANAYLRAMG